MAAEKFNITDYDIPTWVIEKKYRTTKAIGVCCMAMAEKTYWVERETEKAFLIGWQVAGFYTKWLNGCGEFWVAKSLLKKRGE
jgi:hypothetical protein